MHNHNCNRGGVNASTTRCDHSSEVLNFLGYAGVMFIIYGVVSEGTGTVWAPLEKWVNPLSALLTLVGTILTAISAYYYSPQTHPPELFSK